MAKVIKPRALTKGSTIGIAAPSSSFLKAKFDRGIEILKSLGFKVRFSKDIYRKKGYLAGSDEERAAELNRMFADEDLDAIMFARGGYGIQRIMPLLDFDALEKSPKIIVGYSDLTALTSHITSHLNMSCIHGPVVTALAEDGGKAAASLKEVLTSTKPLGEAGGSPLTVIRGGEAKGRFRGGCLTLITSSIGTPYQIDTKNNILLVEDLSERVYRYDRMLTQIRNAGLLSGVKGVVFGSLELDPAETQPDALMPMIEEFFEGFDGPVVAGLKTGHTSPFFSVPLGVECSLFAYCSGRPSTGSGRSNTKLVFNEAALV